MVQIDPSNGYYLEGYKASNLRIMHLRLILIKVCTARLARELTLGKLTRKTSE